MHGWELFSSCSFSAGCMKTVAINKTTTVLIAESMIQIYVDAVSWLCVVQICWGPQQYQSEQYQHPIWQKNIPTLGLFWVTGTSSQRNTSRALEGTSSKTVEFLWEYCIKYWRRIKNPNHPPSMPEVTPELVHQLLYTYWLIANLHIHGCCSPSCLLLKSCRQCNYLQFVNLPI